MNLTFQASIDDLCKKYLAAGHTSVDSVWVVIAAPLVTPRDAVVHLSVPEEAHAKC